MTKDEAAMGTFTARDNQKCANPEQWVPVEFFTWHRNYCATTFKRIYKTE
jgi:hypothetical protein